MQMPRKSESKGKRRRKSRRKRMPDVRMQSGRSLLSATRHLMTSKTGRRTRTMVPLLVVSQAGSKEALSPLKGKRSPIKRRRRAKSLRGIRTGTSDL